MRPTISEQLAGIRRILVDVVQPEVRGAYPADMLLGIVANLEMLERSWTSVIPFLTWDNRETARVVQAAQPHVGAELGSRITDVLGAPAPDPVDADALEARNTSLREVLAAVIPVLAAGGPATAAVYADICRHLHARIERFPLTLTAPMPSGAR